MQLSKRNYLLLVEFQVELPPNCLSFGVLAFSVGEGDAKLDQLEIVAVCLYHVVLELVLCVRWQVYCTWELRVLNKINRSYIS